MSDQNDPNQPTGETPAAPAADDMESRIVNRVFAGLRKAGMFSQLAPTQQRGDTPPPATSGFPTASAPSVAEQVVQAMTGFYAQMQSGTAPIGLGAPKPTGPSFSDKGPAASSAARDPLAIIQNDPRKATMDDFRRLAAEKGQGEAQRLWTDHVMNFLRGVRIRPDRGR